MVASYTAFSRGQWPRLKAFFLVMQILVINDKDELYVILHEKEACIGNFSFPHKKIR